MSTVAIHAIWTTYLTWLPGDPRGHWSPLFDFYGRLIEMGHKLNLPDPQTVKHAKSLTKEPERVLTPIDREIVADTICKILHDDLEGRVPVYGAAIERTHIHLLFGEMAFNIEHVIGRIKSQSSSALLKNGTEPGRTRTWTTGFWRVFVFDLDAIPDIQTYIERHNLRQNLPRSPYKWITPFI